MKPGLYWHYKGGAYMVVGSSTHSETKEELVNYYDLSGNLWSRPRSMFTDVLVSSEGLEIERFERIGDDLKQILDEQKRELETLRKRDKQKFEMFNRFYQLSQIIKELDEKGEYEKLLEKVKWEYENYKFVFMDG